MDYHVKYQVLQVLRIIAAYHNLSPVVIMTRSVVLFPSSALYIYGSVSGRLTLRGLFARVIWGNAIGLVYNSPARSCMST
jgi:hypothetical protein